MANYKKDLISIVLSLQAEKESAVTKILNEVRVLNEKCTSLESQLLVTKNVNSLLQERGY